MIASIVNKRKLNTTIALSLIDGALEMKRGFPIISLQMDRRPRNDLAKRET